MQMLVDDSSFSPNETSYTVNSEKLWMLFISTAKIHGIRIRTLGYLKEKSDCDEGSKKMAISVIRIRMTEAIGLSFKTI
jgi:hypothetical protein